jgi:hypothetical protein
MWAGDRCWATFCYWVLIGNCFGCCLRVTHGRAGRSIWVGVCGIVRLFGNRASFSFLVIVRLLVYWSSSVRLSISWCGTIRERRKGQHGTTSGPTGDAILLHSDPVVLLRHIAVSVTRPMIRTLVHVPVGTRLILLHACGRRLGPCMEAMLLHRGSVNNPLVRIPSEHACMEPTLA